MPLQRYRPVLTESFVEGLHSRGVDVDAVRIEPGASQRQAQGQVVLEMQSASRCMTSTAMFSWMGCTLPEKPTWASHFVSPSVGPMVLVNLKPRAHDIGCACLQPLRSCSQLLRSTRPPLQEHWACC